MWSAPCSISRTAAARPLAAAAVAGRPLAVRAMVAALRAGASLIAVPSTLHDAEADRALRRMPALAAAVRWLTPGRPRARGGAGRVAAPARLLADPRERPRRPARRARAAGRGAGALGRRLRAGGARPRAARRRALAGAGGGAAGRRAARAPPGGRGGPGPRGDGTSRRGARDRRTWPAPRRRSRPRWASRWIPASTGTCTGRCSRRISRLLVRTPVAPNHVSLVSLAIGLLAIWCFWHATTASALLGVLAYAARLHRGPCRRRDRPPDVPGVAPGGHPRLGDRHDHPGRHRPRPGRQLAAGRAWSWSGSWPPSG